MSQRIPATFAGHLPDSRLRSINPTEAVTRNLSFGDAKRTRKHITVSGESCLVSIQLGDTELLFVGSQDVIDLDAEPGDGWLTDSFSRFLPYSMILRHIFGEQCWRPLQHRACVIVDDPLLQANYGFLNFRHLLQLTEQHNFHTTIAFIPHNFRRTSGQIATLFQENPERFHCAFTETITLVESSPPPIRF